MKITIGGQLEIRYVNIHVMLTTEPHSCNGNLSEFSRQNHRGKDLVTQSYLRVVEKG